MEHSYQHSTTGLDMQTCTPANRSGTESQENQLLRQEYLDPETEVKLDLLLAYTQSGEFVDGFGRALESILDLHISLEKEQELMRERWASRQREIGAAVLRIRTMYEDFRDILGEDVLPPFEASICPTEDGSLPSMTVAQIEEGIA
jgi:hypothetical protein